jgi:hypothetical protein
VVAPSYVLPAFGLECFKDAFDGLVPALFGSVNIAVVTGEMKNAVMFGLQGYPGTTVLHQPKLWMTARSLL